MLSIRLAKVRLSIIRNMYLPSLINQVMLAYLFIIQAGFHWWYLLVPVLYLVWIYNDMRYIWKREVTLSLTESYEWRRYIKEFEEFKNAVIRLQQQTEPVRRGQTSQIFISEE